MHGRLISTDSGIKILGWHSTHHKKPCDGRPPSGPPFHDVEPIVLAGWKFWQTSALGDLGLGVHWSSELRPPGIPWDKTAIFGGFPLFNSSFSCGDITWDLSLHMTSWKGMTIWQSFNQGTTIFVTSQTCYGNSVPEMLGSKTLQDLHENSMRSMILLGMGKGRKFIGDIQAKKSGGNLVPPPLSYPPPAW